MSNGHPDWISVISMLLDGSVPVNGFWYELDETSVPHYKGRPITHEEYTALAMVEESRI